MKPMLPSPLSALVAGAMFVLSAASVQAAETVGNAKVGETKAAMCIGCHGIVGFKSGFPEVHKVPKIHGQTAGYIVASLNAYQKGERRHPSMRGIAAGLSQQDMADLGAYFSGQGLPALKGDAPSKQPSVEVAALIEKGGCTSCHGVNFSKPIDPSYPKIGGQHADFLYVALKAYTVEGHNLVGRSNPIMAGMAKQFKPAELRQIANYLASIDGEIRTVRQAAFR
jgi:cytochrome c553